MTPIVELPDHLKNIRKEDWQKLFDLLPEIEQTKSFYEYKEVEQQDNNPSSRILTPPDVVLKFQQTVRGLGIIKTFEMPFWEEGEKILNEKKSNFDQYDISTLCKLISLIEINEYVKRCTLVYWFDKGVILKILYSLHDKIFPSSPLTFKKQFLERVMLYHFKESWIEVTIEAYFDDEKLVIEGYDIGERVSESWGDSDYEYVTSVEGDNLIKLYPLMEVQVRDKEGLLKAIAAKFNTNTCYSEFCDFLAKNNIRYGGFSWA